MHAWSFYVFPPSTVGSCCNGNRIIRVTHLRRCRLLLFYVLVSCGLSAYLLAPGHVITLLIVAIIILNFFRTECVM